MSPTSFTLSDDGTGKDIDIVATAVSAQSRSSDIADASSFACAIGMQAFAYDAAGKPVERTCAHVQDIEAIADVYIQHVHVDIIGDIEMDLPPQRDAQHALTIVSGVMSQLMRSL